MAMSRECGSCAIKLYLKLREEELILRNHNHEFTMDERNTRWRKS